MTNSPLSEKVQALIKKARIVSFASWQDTHSPEVLQRFQAADDQGRYLTDEDLQYLTVHTPKTSEFIPAAKILRDQVSDIVDEARAGVLITFPSITEPGGGLHPPERAGACWRDFWHFLRCTTYGIAGQHTDYTSTGGLQYMQLLYQELQVPLDAMVVGLEGIKMASLKRVAPEQQEKLAPYFEHLTEQLKKF
jgi:Phycobilisome protein